MKLLTVDHLKPLSLGCAILGSGGGGDPRYDLLMATHALQRFGPVRLMETSELTQKDLVVPIAFIGAPLVSQERLPSGREFTALLQAIEEVMGQAPTVLMPGEIGGANAFTPLSIAARCGLPLLNADTIGRAFPALQMSSCHLHGVSPTPAFIVDHFGNVEVIYPNTCEKLEEQARQLTMRCGSSALLGVYLMKGDQAATAVIKDSYTTALNIGTTLELGVEPFLALPQVSELTRGKIVDIDQVIRDGFLTGSVTLDQGLTLLYQNEYLLAKNGSSVLAATPDILMLIEEDSGNPITSESLKFGLRVILIRLPAPPIWNTAEGIKLVGPQAFGGFLCA